MGAPRDFFLQAQKSGDEELLTLFVLVETILRIMTVSLNSLLRLVVLYVDAIIQNNSKHNVVQMKTLVWQIVSYDIIFGFSRRLRIRNLIVSSSQTEKNKNFIK